MREFFGGMLEKLGLGGTKATTASAEKPAAPVVEAIKPAEGEGTKSVKTVSELAALPQNLWQGELRKWFDNGKTVRVWSRSVGKFVEARIGPGKFPNEAIVWYDAEGGEAHKSVKISDLVRWERGEQG